MVQGNLIPQGELKVTRRKFQAVRVIRVQGNLIPQGELKERVLLRSQVILPKVQGNLIPQGELKETQQLLTVQLNLLSKEI